MSNYILYKVWDESIYPFPIFNGANNEVQEWLNNFMYKAKWGGGGGGGGDKYIIHTLN